jgi:hypothetical protein
MLKLILEHMRGIYLALLFNMTIGWTWCKYLDFEIPQAVFPYVLLWASLAGMIGLVIMLFIRGEK